MKLWPQFGWWRSWISSLRLRLREWLGVEEHDRMLMATVTDEGLKAALDKFRAETEAMIGETEQRLQAQITELGALDGPLAKPTAKPADTKMQMDPGFVRFSDRKRQWEASKRKPLETSTGKQIEENHRLIASGTRKTE